MVFLWQGVPLHSRAVTESCSDESPPPQPLLTLWSGNIHLLGSSGTQCTLGPQELGVGVLESAFR